MKHLLCFLLLLFTVTAFTQNTKIPQTVNFQAVARDANGTPKANQGIQVRLTVREGSAAGNSVYCANYNSTTNAFGAFNIQLNRGDFNLCANSPSFESVDWESGNKWVQVEYRFDLGAFTDLGATEIASAFYALSAQTAEKVTFINTDNAEDGFVLAYDAAANIWKPRQLILNGINVVNGGPGISAVQNGNTVTIENIGDRNPGDDITTDTDAQGDVSGKFPALSVGRIQGRAVANTAPANGQVMKWNGSAWAPAPDETGTGGGADNWGTQVVQTSGPALTGDGTATNPMRLAQQGATAGQVLKWDGSNWTPQNDIQGGGGSATTVNVNPNGLGMSGDSAAGYLIVNTGDTNPNDDLTVNSTAQGDVAGPFNNLQLNPGVVGAAEIADETVGAADLSPMGAAPGQVLKWNGSAWAPQNDEDTDAQTLSITNNQLTISGSNSSVTLPAGATYVEGQGIDISPTNVISVDNTVLTTGSVAGGDLSGNFGNLQLNPNSVGSNEIINGSITQADLAFPIPTGQWQNNGPELFYNVVGGNVGIGVNDPVAPLHVANLTTTVNEAILGVGSTEGAGVAGLGDNFTPVGKDKTGVYGSAQIGILGIGNTKTGTNNLGVGVFAIGQGNNAVGILGEAGPGTGSIAGFFGGDVLHNGGAFFLDQNSDTKITQDVTADGFGQIRTFGQNGARNVYVSSPAGLPNNGAVAVYGSSADQSSPSAWMYAMSSNNGDFILNAADGDLRARAFVGTPNPGPGVMQTYGPGQSNTDNKPNVALTAPSGRPNEGYVIVYDANSSIQAGIQVDVNGQGYIFGDYLSANLKNFRMVHPNNPQKEIWYACIEGPEAAAYERGTATLVNGTGEVVFSEHFQAVANSQTMTVIVTPLSADSKGMAVVEKTRTGFKVRELLQGEGSYQFDWEVKCIRIGYENYQAVRDRLPYPPQATETSEPDPAPATDRLLETRKNGPTLQQLKALRKKE